MVAITTTTTIIIIIDHYYCNTTETISCSYHSAGSIAAAIVAFFPISVTN